jgi:fermentation-respiration switch protein FrsA (DUF1100 family)
MNAMSITQRKVHFPSEGLNLTGDLYLPDKFDENKKYDGILITGSWITVKEQMAGLYARKLAEKGFVALAFDFRFYGESEGEPRNYESPENKIKDWKNAITYLSSQSYIKNIFGLGICASAQYLSRVALEDKRLKKIALVAPWFHNADIAREVYGGEEGVNARIEAGTKAKKKYAATGESDTVVASSDTDASAAMYGPFTYYLDTKRGKIAGWDNRFAVMSWPEWLEYDAIRIADKLETPTLLVHSEDAAIPHGANQFYSRLKSADKNFVWTKGNQFDFYDQEPTVNFSVQQVADWFGKN